MPAAGIEIVTILMNIHNDKLRVGLVMVVNPVSVMRVDVDVANPLQSEARSQRLDHDTLVVKHAEAGGTAGACVVVSTDWLEGAACLPLYDLVKALESGTGDHGPPLEDMVKTLFHQEWRGARTDLQKLGKTRLQLDLYKKETESMLLNWVRNLAKDI